MSVETVPVQRIITDTGSHIEPPFNGAWSDLDKLRWHAAVASLDSGRTVRVVEGNSRVKKWGVWVRIPGQYNAQYGNTTAMIGDYREAWSWLNGFAAGARS